MKRKAPDSDDGREGSRKGVAGQPKGQLSESEYALVRFNNLRAASIYGDAEEAKETALALGFEPGMEAPCPAQLLLAPPSVYGEVKPMRDLSSISSRDVREWANAIRVLVSSASSFLYSL
jgi:hypothetical protein